MRSGSSLTDRVCRAATFPEPEGNWKYPQKSKMPQIQPITLSTFTVYSLDPDTPASERGHHELAARQKQVRKTKQNRTRMTVEAINDSVRFQSFVSAE